MSNKVLLAGNLSTNKGVIFRQGGGFCLLEEKQEINVDKLREAGYTVLNFEDGEFILFPLSRLPIGLNEGDVLEITITKR